MSIKSAWLICIATQVVCILADYNCLRKGVGCAAGGTCLPTGNCSCVAGNGGFDCKLLLSTTNTTCTVQCENGGTCYSGDKCYCADGFYGSKCENKRASVNCTENSMTVNINPHGDFGGKIFVYGKRNADECVLVSVNASSTINGADANWQGFALNIPYNGTCGDTEVTSNETSVKSYELKIVTEYNSLMMTGIDQISVVKCSVPEGGRINITSSIKEVTYGDNVYKDTDLIEESFSPVAFKFLAGDKPLENSTVNLGDVIVLSFKLAESNTLKSLKVNQCTAKNPTTGATINLVENGCRSEDAKQLISENADGRPNKVDNRTVELKITAFKFVDASQVAFTCDVILCIESDTACATQCAESTPVITTTTAPTSENVTVPSTDNNSTAAGNETTTTVTRRKRAAGRQETVTGFLIVQDGAETGGSSDSKSSTESPNLNSENTSRDFSSEECFQKTEVVTVVIILSLAIAITVLIIIILLARHFKNREQKVANFEPPKELVPQFTIPRVNL